MATFEYNGGGNCSNKKDERKQPQSRPNLHIICELPPGTSVMALDGQLVACHPNHAPIYIGQGNPKP